jgi:class 3 adenylate cyclase
MAQIEPSSRPTLLFIPDISGFTRFVTDTEITHSQHIIEELLEVLIDANDIDLEISEIEGDAILFYRYDKEPTTAEILGQVRTMFLQFHAHVKKFETQRICNCGACNTTHSLQLKFIVHYGETTLKNVKHFSKLFGSDVIVAHRLMKNNIPLKEYLLLTRPVIASSPDWGTGSVSAWASFESSSEEYDTGSIDYAFIPLEPLSSHIPEPKTEDFSDPGVTAEVLRFERIIDAPINLTFDVLSDLSVRHEWTPNLKDSDNLNHAITQEGSTHRCVIKDNGSDPFFISHSFNIRSDLITFAESDLEKGITSVYTLEKIDDAHTRLVIHSFVRDNFFIKAVARLIIVPRLRRSVVNAYESFNDLCAALAEQNTGHTSHIVIG